MRCRQDRRPQRRYRGCDDSGGRILGSVMIAAGLLLLFLCIPGWAWAALAGAALVALGYWLIQCGRR
ncbi:MAG: hypothetical protein IJZ74_03090 [Clostridia bacterium]|nr:hypothetical protein [Clostridia bacterium]